METLHTRLDDQKEEVLRITETFGRFRAMRDFGVRDYVCFSKWLKEVTGDENFGVCPKISPDSSQTLGDQLVVAFLRKVAQLQTENERLRERINALEWHLAAASEKEETQALAVLEVCQV